MKNTDWMGYNLMKGDMFTFHHIRKKEHGGTYNRDNGAILCGKSSHPYIHIIEHIDPELFMYVNDMLLLLNRTGYLDAKVIFEIDNVLSSFEREYQGRDNARGKRLIKEVYTRRDLSSFKHF